MKIDLSLMKSLVVLAVAMLAAACSHDTDMFNQGAKEQEFSDNFMNNVMGGQQIDANQTWSTAAKGTVNVTVNLDYGQDYNVYVFTTNPLLNTAAKYIGMGSVVSGNSLDITIARPTDITSLYVACVDKKGAYTVQQFDMSSNNTSVTIGQEEAAATRSARKVSTRRDDYIRQKNEFINDLKGYDNNWAGYYDLSTIDQYGQLNKIEYTQANNWQGGPVYGDNAHFLLPEGKTFTITSQTYNNGLDGTVIVVKGTLVIPSSIAEFRLWGTGEYTGVTHGQTIVIENGGRVVCNSPRFVLANKSNIINLGGTFEMNGTYVDYANGADKGFCNFGTIIGTNGAGFNFAGGTPYYNGGVIDLSGDGVIKFNGNITYVNAGSIHAYNCAWQGVSSLTDWGMASAGQNSTVVNLCHMQFDKFFAVHTYTGTDGSLLNAVSGLYTNQGGQIELGKQAEIVCGDWYDNGVTCKASANADDYAVMKVNGTVTEVNGGITGASGYFYFDINAIDGSRDGGWHKTQFENHMLKYTVSEATAPDNITIPADADGCNSIGYNPDANGGGGGDFNSNYIYYAFEDLGSIGDFDFNDVVIRLSTPVNGKSDIEVVAAGGTMETYVNYGSGDAPVRLGAEVHAALGVSSVNTMVNTTGVDVNRFAKLATIPVAADADLTMLPLGIECKGNDGQTIRVTRSMANNGRAPLSIVVTGNDEGKWFWPTERCNIAVSYEDFGAWGASVSSHPEWYKNATGSVVTY